MSSTSERRRRRKFTDEFKAEAVALVEESGGQIAKVAKELGIYDSSLGNWVRQAREQAEGAPTPAERAEIHELKRELERVTRERDILGKATAYFSARDRGTGDGDLLVRRSWPPTVGGARPGAARSAPQSSTGARPRPTIMSNATSTRPHPMWCGDIERHEAFLDLAVMKGHRHASVAAGVLKLRAA